MNIGGTPGAAGIPDDATVREDLKEVFERTTGPSGVWAGRDFSALLDSIEAISDTNAQRAEFYKLLATVLSSGEEVVSHKRQGIAGLRLMDRAVKDLAHLSRDALSEAERGRVKRFEQAIVKRTTTILKRRRVVRLASKIGRGTQTFGGPSITLDPGSWPEKLLSGHPTKPFLEHEKYRELWEKSGTDQPFLMWMESYLEDHPVPEAARVAYLEEARDRERYEVSFEGGRAYSRFKGEPLDTSSMRSSYRDGVSGRAIFVVDAEDKIYAGEPAMGRFYHSSFLGGRPVLGAGEIEIDRTGKVRLISNMSGHYRPESARFRETLRVLERQGVDLTQVTYEEFDAVRKQARTYNAKDFLEGRVHHPPVSGAPAGQMWGTAAQNIADAYPWQVRL